MFKLEKQCEYGYLPSHVEMPYRPVWNYYGDRLLIAPSLAAMAEVKHYGVFQFKDGVSEEQIETCFAEMNGMVGKIPGLLDMINGPYESGEGMNDGFTHGFIMTFDSAESRDAYLPHAEHERVKEIVVPCLERVVVFDFAV